MSRRSLLAALAATVVVACGGNDDDSSPATATATAIPSATATAAEPTATSTDEPGECPLTNEGVCEVALEIEGALADGDTSALQSILAPQEVECSGEEPQGIDAAAAFCRDQPAGTVLEGYLTGPRSSDAISYVAPEVFDLGRYLGEIAEQKTDPAGAGAPALATVGSAEAHCAGCYALAYTWIVERTGADVGPTYMRMLLELGIAEADEGWIGRYFWFGHVLGDYTLLTGGDRGDMQLLRWPREPFELGEAFLLGDAAAVANTDGDCLNIRAQPNTEAEILECVAPGRVATVVDGPVSVADVAWLKLSHSGRDGTTVGWAAAQYLVHWP